MNLHGKLAIYIEFETISAWKSLKLICHSFHTTDFFMIVLIQRGHDILEALLLTRKHLCWSLFLMKL